MILRSYELHSLIYIVIYKSKEKENEKKNALILTPDMENLFEKLHYWKF